MVRRFGLSAFVVSLTCLLLPAVTEPIGTAVSAGNIVINNASAAGTATVFEGSILGSDGKATTQVHLNNGAHLRLFLASSGKLYRDHVDLIYGAAEIADYSAKANGLRVTADANSSAEVSKQGKTIQVASLSGDVHVFNAQGIIVANLVPGRIMSFFPQDAGASAPSSLTGCPTKSGNVFLLKDETSNVTVQLQGGNIKANKRVQVTGTMVPNAAPAAGATQVINVTGVKDAGGTCAGAAGAGTGSGGSGLGASNGLYIGAAAAVVAGVTAGVLIGTNTGNGGNSSASLANGSSQITYYTDTSGNLFTVTTTTNNGTTSQTIIETTKSGTTSTVSQLPSGTTLTQCLSPCANR